MSGTKFYLSRFAISGTLPIGPEYDFSQSGDEQKFDALMQYLNHDGPVVESTEGGWYFGRVEEHGGRIFGKFGKTYSDELTRYDEDVGDFVELDEPVPDADYSMFVIDFEHRIIAFSSTYRVRNSNFINNFEDGFRNVISSAATLEMWLIENEETLEHVLEEYPVFKFEAELRPTNPGPDPAYEDLDDSMQEMLVEKFGISAERFEGEGINVHEDFIQQVSSMSMSEYGESWRVEYGDDEVLKVVSSDSEPATTRLSEELDQLGELYNYADNLIENALAFIE